MREIDPWLSIYCHHLLGWGLPPALLRAHSIIIINTRALLFERMYQASMYEEVCPRKWSLYIYPQHSKTQQLTHCSVDQASSGFCS